VTGKKPKQSERPGLDGYGRTPLHYAASEANLDALVELLNQGLDPNAVDDNGWTPLHFAAQANSAACVSALLEAGAISSVVDSNGNTPLLRAVFSSKGEGEVIRLLRAAGADPLHENASGVSAVSLARMIGNYPVAQFFADVDCPSVPFSAP